MESITFYFFKDGVLKESVKNNSRKVRIMMGQKKLRSLGEWRELVMECRKSGLTDKEWCEQNGINLSSFYNAICKLRHKACDIPTRESAQPVMDLTVRKQDVVAIDIVQENPIDIKPVSTDIRNMEQAMNLDNSYTMELATKNGILRISNQTDLRLLDGILQIMRRLEC